jgi:adenosylcobinamide-GDP ribazoletransferase
MFQAYWGQFVLALGFLTRLPIKLPEGDWQGRLADAAWSFPIVGVLVGALGGFAFFLATYLGLPVFVAAICAVTAQVLLIGALHEDGLSDVADGFGGGQEKEQKLRIMRDSRIGAYGVIALILALLARVGSIAEIEDVMVALISAGALSRAMMAMAMIMLLPARGDGLGFIAGREKGPAFAGMAIGFALLIISAGFTNAVWLVLIAGIITAAVGWVAKQQIGGQTGDVLGTCQQLVEIALLFAWLSLLA